MKDHLESIKRISRVYDRIMSPSIIRMSQMANNVPPAILEYQRILNRLSSTDNLFANDSLKSLALSLPQSPAYRSLYSTMDHVQRISERFNRLNKLTTVVPDSLYPPP